MSEEQKTPNSSTSTQFYYLPALPFNCCLLKEGDKLKNCPFCAEKFSRRMKELNVFLTCCKQDKKECQAMVWKLKEEYEKFKFFNQSTLHLFQDDAGVKILGFRYFEYNEKFQDLLFFTNDKRCCGDYTLLLQILYALQNYLLKLKRYKEYLNKKKDAVYKMLNERSKVIHLWHRNRKLELAERMTQSVANSQYKK